MPDSTVKADNVSSLSGGGVGFPDGSVSSPSMKFTNDGDTGLYRIGNNTIGVAANGARVGEIGPGYGGFTGNIIQVQSTTKSDTFSTTPTVNTWTDITGLSVSITPRYTTSKIMIMFNVMMGENSPQLNHIRLVRGSTAISIGDTAGNRLLSTGSTYNTGAVNTMSINSAFFLDSPNTTSSTTYKLQLIATAPSAVYINRNQRDDNASYEPRGTSSITVMEVQQ